MSFVTYTVITVSVITLIWIFNKSRKNKIQKVQLKEKELDEDNQTDAEKQKAATNKLKILIWRPVGADLMIQVGKPLIVEEKPDSSGNLIAINEEKRFKEDLNFSKDRIYELMEYDLGLQNIDKKEKLIILNEKIKDQENIVKKINLNVEENKNYNALDEEKKLKQLKVYFYSLQKEFNGNYMRLGFGGIRQYEFVAVDGVLYPYIFGSKFFRVYPDLISKKKIFNQENTIFRNEAAALFNKHLPMAALITLVVGLILIGIGTAMIVYDNEESDKLNAMANQGSVICTQTLSQITKNYGGIINDYMQVKQSELDKDINTKNNNNNIPSIGDIYIDPKKITQ